MRALVLSDGFASPTPPTGGPLTANGLLTYANDAAFVADNGAAQNGDFYLNTTDLSLHFYYGAWYSTTSAPPSSLTWRLQDNPPLESDSLGLDTLDFDYLSAQQIWATIVVPSNYVSGVQIKLSGGLFAAAVASGKAKFKATTYLIRNASTVLGTYSNSYDSTNAEVTVPASTSEIKAIGDVDLTNASGAINAVGVVAGDILLVKLFRDTTNESSSAAADARFLRFSMTPKFTA